MSPANFPSKDNMRDSDIAYEKIKKMIVTVKLPPGVAIEEGRLMKSLGLGRTPIREALHRLAIDGLVVIAPRRGTFVSDVSVTELHDIFEFRCLIEGNAARLAAQRATDEVLSEFDRLVTGVDVLPVASDEHVNIDTRFHELIAEASGNELLKAALDRVHSLSLRLLYLTRTRMGTVSEAIHDYMRVLQAIKEGDADEAERAIIDHVLEFRQKVRNSL